MICETMQQFLRDLQVLLGCSVRLFDDKGRGMMSIGGAQPLCLLTHSSEFKVKGARLCAHCYASDAAALQEAAAARDVVVRSCPLGFYTVTCPIYDAGRLLGFLQVGDLLLQDEVALMRTRELALSYLVGEEKRIDERLSLAPRFSQERFLALPSLLRAACSYIEAKNLFPTEQITLGMLAKQYIQNHLQNKLTLADVAAHLHCSTSTLTKAFRREFHTTVMQYLNERRLSRACRLLSNTELRIGAICEECGFSGAEYFSALFKETFGLSPLAYRKKQKARHTPQI